jgi:hypothetical protein
MRGRLAARGQGWSVTQPFLNRPISEPKTAGYIQFLFEIAILSQFAYVWSSIAIDASHD